MSKVLHTKIKPFLNIDLVTVVETGEVRYNADLHKRLLCSIPQETLTNVRDKIEEFLFVVQDELDKRITGVK